MIEKLKWDEQPEDAAKEVQNLIDQLVDAVNKLETMAKNTNTVLESLVQENNIHEKQIDELQMKVEPEKCKTPTDPYAEQRKWIGCVCRFWDDNSKITKHFGILTRINETAIVRYAADNGFWYCACEPVKPDDDIIYKGGDNE